MNIVAQIKFHQHRRRWDIRVVVGTCFFQIILPCTLVRGACLLPYAPGSLEAYAVAGGTIQKVGSVAGGVAEAFASYDNPITGGMARSSARTQFVGGRTNISLDVSTGQNVSVRACGDARYEDVLLFESLPDGDYARVEATARLNINSSPTDGNTSASAGWRGFINPIPLVGWDSNGTIYGDPYLSVYTLDVGNRWKYTFHTKVTIGNYETNTEKSVTASSSLEFRVLTPGVIGKLKSKLTPADVLDGAITQVTSTPQTWKYQFKPKYGLTLDEAADVLQVDHFNWVQWVVEDTDPNRPTVNGIQPALPYLDSPIGGWDYQHNLPPGIYTGNDSQPGYWDEDGTQVVDPFSLANNRTADTLTFQDSPGAGGGGRVRFKTALMGVDANGEPLLLRGSDFQEWYSDATGLHAIRGTIAPDWIVTPGLTHVGSFPITQLSPSDVALLTSYGIDVSAMIAIPGDFNGNGTVGTEDYDVWRANFGITNTTADGNGNGVVDAADYIVWRKNFGATLGSGSSSEISVPEPTAYSFGVIAVTLVLGLWRTHLKF